MEISLAKLAWTLAGMALASVIVFQGARWLERKLLYFPDPARLSPSAAGLSGVVERTIESADGTELVSWFAPARAGHPTILYFHGNAGHLANRAERMATYTEAGFGMLMLAYRGYSGSAGSPSERRNVADARRAYDALRADGIAPEDIVVYGESLGSGVAIQLAVDVQVAALVLDAPYTSIVDVGAAAYPFLPVRLVMRDRYDSASRVGNLKSPVLILHGARDEIVPVEMGRKLYAMIKAEKELLVFPEAGHLDHAQFGSHQAVIRWLRRVRPNGSGKANNVKKRATTK